MTARPRQVGSILFSAGLGTRLRPLTDAVAKPALPLLDVPLGAFGLASLQHSAPPVVVNVSHLPDSTERALRPFAQDVEFVRESPRAYGTGGTLQALRHRIGRRVTTLNADALVDVEPRDVLETHARHGASATVLVGEVDVGADFVLDGDRVVATIDRGKEPRRRGAMFLGLAVFERSALVLLRARRPLGLVEGLLGALVDRGEVAAHLHHGYAVDVGTLDRYLRASLDVLHGRGPPPPVRLPGEVVTVPGGRAFVGAGAKAHARSIGPGAILLAGCAVAPGARVRNSIVWPGEQVPDGIELDHAVLALGRTLGVTRRRTVRGSSDSSGP